MKRCHRNQAVGLELEKESKFCKYVSRNHVPKYPPRVAHRRQGAFIHSGLGGMAASAIGQEEAGYHGRFRPESEALLGNAVTVLRFRVQRNNSTIVT